MHFCCLPVIESLPCPEINRNKNMHPYGHISSERTGYLYYLMGCPGYILYNG